MARTRGSKNKSAALSIDEQIATVNADIDSLQDQIKQKKAVLKQLTLAKAAEDQKKILEAAETSGKTVDEIITLLSN